MNTNEKSPSELSFELTLPQGLVPLGILGGGVPPGSPNSEQISDQKL